MRNDGCIWATPCKTLLHGKYIYKKKKITEICAEQDHKQKLIREELLSMSKPNTNKQRGYICRVSFLSKMVCLFCQQWTRRTNSFLWNKTHFKGKQCARKQQGVTKIVCIQTIEQNSENISVSRKFFLQMTITQLIFSPSMSFIELTGTCYYHPRKHHFIYRKVRFAGVYIYLHRFCLKTCEPVAKYAGPPLPLLAPKPPSPPPPPLHSPFSTHPSPLHQRPGNFVDLSNLKLQSFLHQMQAVCTQALC